MNKKIFFSAISVVAALALMGGATFAFFSSSATSTGNIFASGTLALKLDDTDETTPAATVTASIGASNLAPGGTVSGFISMHNDGSIAIQHVDLSGTETATSVPDLATKLQFTSVKLGDDNTCSTGTSDITASLIAAIGGNTLDKLNLTEYDLPGLAVSATKYVCMTLTFDPLADNTFQGKSITEKFTFVGDQDASQ